MTVTLEEFLLTYTKFFEILLNQVFFFMHQVCGCKTYLIFFFYDKIMTFNFLETKEMIKDQIFRILLENMYPERFKKLLSFEIELVAEEGQRIEIISEIFQEA